MCHYLKPNIVCGLLYVISEVFKAHGSLAPLLTKPEKLTEEQRKQGMGVFNFFLESAAADEKKDKEPSPAKSDVEVIDPKNLDDVGFYDGRKREPLFAHAEVREVTVIA